METERQPTSSLMTQCTRTNRDANMMRGMKGNTRPACGLLPALQRRTVRALAAALVVGIGLAGVIWHEGLAALLRPIASGAGAVTTSGNGQPASFAYPGAPAAASLGATSSLVSTHVEAERHDPGVAGTGPGKEEEKEEPKREEDWAAAGIERDWGEDDDDDGFAELDMVEAEQQQEEEEAPRSAGGTDDAAAVHDMGDDDDDGMLKALEEEMAWKQKQNPEEIEQNESLARQHQQRSEEAEEAKRKVEQRRREEPVLTEEERAEQFLEECKAEFWERSFLPRGQEALPPILYSFPGSGNTWTRHILDFATGVPTGSVHKLTRPSPLPGQGVCNTRVSVVKAHPNQFRPDELLDLPKTGSPSARCRAHGISPGFRRFILLVRNPFDAIWSDYRRKFKTPVVLQDDFDKKGFTMAALKYSQVWVQMVKDFRYLRRELPPGDTFKLTYEDWLDEENRPRLLDRLVDFIGLNDGDSPQERRRRLECAFPLAQESGGGRRGSGLLEKLDGAAVVMSTETVYTPELACRMWEVLAGAATALSYGLPNGITEQDCKRVLREMRKRSE